MRTHSASYQKVIPFDDAAPRAGNSLRPRHCPRRPASRDTWVASRLLGQHTTLLLQHHDAWREMPRSDFAPPGETRRIRRHWGLSCHGMMDTVERSAKRPESPQPILDIPFAWRGSDATIIVFDQLLREPPLGVAAYSAGASAISASSCSSRIRIFVPSNLMTLASRR